MKNVTQLTIVNKLLLNPTDDVVDKFEFLPFSMSIVNNLKR